MIPEIHPQGTVLKVSVRTNGPTFTWFESLPGRPSVPFAVTRYILPRVEELILIQGWIVESLSVEQLADFDTLRFGEDLEARERLKDL